MRRFKTKVKQALTLFLTLFLSFAILPNVLPEGSTFAADNSTTYIELYTDESATQTTDEYSMENLHIYMRANSAADDEYWPWVGLYKGALTSDTWSKDNLSMIWAYSDTGYGDQTAAYNGDNAVDLLGDGNSQGFGNDYSLSDLDPGTYTVILFKNYDTYGPIAYKQFTIKGEYIEPDITLDKEGAVPEYKRGEPVMVTAQASDSSAWVGVFDYDPDFPDGYYARFNVKDVTGSVDLIQLAADAGKPLEYGKKYRVYLCLDQNGDPNHWVKQVKFKLLEIYGDPTWQWDDNYNTATATFTAKHDSTIKKTVTVTGDGITSIVTKEPTEEENGIKTHKATITADMLDFTTENDPPFTDSKEETLPKLNHVHSIVPVPAKDPTCTEPGNTAYYKCSSCNKFFEDAEGTTEIENKDSVNVKALGHDWSGWTPDQATYDAEDVTKMHSRECRREGCSAMETEECSFTHKPSSDPDVELYTCSVCNGQYEETTVPVIKIEKSEYKYGEDVKVNVDINGHTEGWVALYPKGASYLTSLLWYYPHVYPEKVLQSIDGKTDTANQNLGEFSWDDNGYLSVGDYELVYVTYPSNPYQRVGQPVYFSVVKTIRSEEVSLEPTCEKTGNKHVIYEDGSEEDIEIPALGHDPKKEWTYDSGKRIHYHGCSRCKARLNEAFCTFDEGKVTKEPTEREEGEKTYTCTVCGGTYAESIPALADQGVKRVYGNTRYETAMLQADELKATLGVDKFNTIIVATGTNYADALSGAYLGYVEKAPILLVKNGVEDEVKQYIKDNIAAGGTIYLLGGEAVVPDSVTTGLEGIRTKRLFGPTRYETNIEILKAAGVKGEDILICDGTNFADSLSASAAKRPILLVKKGLNDTQRDYLDTLRTKEYYLIGGTGVLPVALENEIKNNYGSVMRLGGADRYETSVKVATEFFDSPEKAILAYAMNYPDGLCGGTLAAYMNAPLLLVRDDKAAITSEYTFEKGIKSGIVLGGSTLISDLTTRTLFKMADADLIYVVN